MIYELSRALETRLRAKKFPVKFAYVPDWGQGGLTGTRVEMSRDREQGDQFSPVQGAQGNPRRMGRRFLSARILVWAKSPLVGAHVGDHERLCEQLVDAVWCALQLGAAAVANVRDFPISEGKYLTSAELVALGVLPKGADGQPEVWPGVVYSLRFRVPRGVSDVNYAGYGLPEGAASGITNGVEVRRNADDPPELVEM